MKRERPYAVFKTPEGAELLVGPLDNWQGAGKACGPHNPPVSVCWTCEAIWQRPMLENSFNEGTVVWMEAPC